MTPIVTHTSLLDGLARLGIGPGDIVLSHTSLSSLGHVVGGAFTVCQAMLDSVSPLGTIVMPGFTPQLCHPSTWPASRRAGLDLDRIAAEIPPFEPSTTPVASSIGAVPDCLRSWSGTRRSAHPHTSFLANGAAATDLVRDHPIEYRFSARGPLGRLCDAEAKVVMLGVSWRKCTALHLGEYAAAYPGRRRGRWLVPEKQSAGVSWHEVDELMVWEGDFDAMGEELSSSSEAVRTTTIGGAECAAVSLPFAARFAEQWLPRHRDLTEYADGPGWRDVVRCGSRH